MDSMYSNNEHSNIMVFRPTMDEFKNFKKYIQYMESQNAHKFGIAKIIPPKGWIPRQQNYMQSDILEMKIPSPIIQNITVKNGSFLQNNAKLDTMTVKDILKLSRSTEFSPPVTSFEGLEKEYWSSLTSDSSIYGTVIQTIFDTKCEIWNLNKLGTILDLLKDTCDMPFEGINTPYLSIGTWKSALPWHVEDMDLYSINYLHTGSPKTWYAIPPKFGREFEKQVAGSYSNLFKKCSAFIRHKMCIISPKVLDSWSIPWNRITQKSGEIIVTFPYGYHSSFNHGFSISETVNFALLRWVEFGKRALLCKCKFDMVQFDMDTFIKHFQPEKYSLWLKGEDHGYHPEDTDKLTITSGRAAPSNIKPKKPRGRPRKITNVPNLNANETNNHNDNPSANVQKDVDSGASCSKIINEHEDSKTFDDEAKNKMEVDENNGILKDYIGDLLNNTNITLEMQRLFNLFITSKNPHCSLCTMISYNKVDFTDDWIIEAKFMTKYALNPLPGPTNPLFQNALSGNGKSVKEGLIRCAICFLTVHKVCYGNALNKGYGEHWMCNGCQKNTLQTKCAHCPLNVGTFKRNSDGVLSHVECSLLFDHSRSKYSRLLSVDYKHGPACIVCGMANGDRFRCNEDDCDSWFHISCGILAGFEYYLNLREQNQQKVFIRCHIHQYNINNDKPKLHVYQTIWAYHDNRRFITECVVKNIEYRSFSNIRLENGDISTHILMDKIQDFCYLSLTPQSQIQLPNGDKGEFLGVIYKPYYFVEFVNNKSDWITQDDIYCTNVYTIDNLKFVDPSGLDKYTTT